MRLPFAAIELPTQKSPGGSFSALEVIISVPRYLMYEADDTFGVPCGRWGERKCISLDYIHGL